jgi:hypothetical protein
LFRKSGEVGIATTPASIGIMPYRRGLVAILWDGPAFDDAASAAYN